MYTKLYPYGISSMHVVRKKTLTNTVSRFSWWNMADEHSVMITARMINSSRFQSMNFEYVIPYRRL